MAAPDRFRIAPLCLAISVRELRDWLADARGAPSIVYARGAVLDGQRDVAVLARSLSDQKLVDLVRHRSGAEWAFIAQRRTRAEAQAETPLAGDAIHPESDAGRVLAMLTRAANFALPCPTNGQIGRALHLDGGRERARYLVAQLIEAGKIRMEDRGRRVTRVVTITASGKRSSREMTPVGAGYEGSPQEGAA